ncbi:unnamed protein product [Calypogeia fissa]
MGSGEARGPARVTLYPQLWRVQQRTGVGQRGPGKGSGRNNVGAGPTSFPEQQRADWDVHLAADIVIRDAPSSTPIVAVEPFFDFVLDKTSLQFVHYDYSMATLRVYIDGLDL